MCQRLGHQYSIHLCLPYYFDDSSSSLNFSVAQLLENTAIAHIVKLMLIPDFSKSLKKFLLQ